MRLQWVWATVGAALLAVGVTAVRADAATGAQRRESREAPGGARRGTTGSAVVKVATRVADWQVSHMDNFDYIPAGPHRLDTEGARDWIQAAFYIGLTHFADLTGN